MNWESVLIYWALMAALFLFVAGLVKVGSWVRGRFGDLVENIFIFVALAIPVTLFIGLTT